MRIKRVGVDIGRVIIGGDGPGDTSFFGDDYLKTPEVLLSVDKVGQLVEYYGKDNVFLVSKCGALVRKKTLDWLYFHDFFSWTGFKGEENIHFCRERRDKAPIAMKLKLDWFIDDKWACLRPMSGVVGRLTLFGPQKRNTWKSTPFQEGSRIGQGSTVWEHVQGWEDISFD